MSSNVLPRIGPRLAQRLAEKKAELDQYRPLSLATLHSINEDVQLLLTYHSNAIELAPLPLFGVPPRPIWRATSTVWANERRWPSV